MSAFNPSGRKEDFSVKLRAQNIKNSKDTTRKLEHENQKMEERLRELKMAMNREKEERERQGGSGFWQRGQTGTLNNYATEVLHEKANKSARKKGMKVLKDEPLDLPTRNGGPGTMKYIAQRSPRVEQHNRDKNKGAKCGQCEDRQASLTCVQCSENYCAGCFAAFHLKGALKRHRSIPLHATGPRQCMSPRPTPPASSRSTTSGGATSGEMFYQQADRYSLGGASGSDQSPDEPAGSSSLLEGAYNEADSAASFQQALLAWRHGDGAQDPEPKPPLPRKAIVVSPVKSPVTMVEHSTSTTTDKANTTPEIKSAPHSLSYAQRLMLKQHRRSEVGQLSTPRLGSADTSVTRSSGLTSVTPRLSSIGRTGELASDDDDGFDEDDRVDFQSLYEAMSTSSEQGSNRVTVSNLTVVDVSNSPKDQQRSASGESSCSYTVQEVSGLEAWQLETQDRLSKVQEGSAQDKRLSKSRETTRVIEKRTRIPKSREVTHIVNHSSIAEDRAEDGALLNKNHSHHPSAKELTQVLSTRKSLGELPTLEEGETAVMKEKPPAPVVTPRPKSVKSRPASARVKSAKSRPTSRAQSRAGSRMEADGLLTKAPSNSLSAIARRTADNSVQYQSPMGGFFLAGVKVEDQVTESRSRPATPSQAEKHVIGSRSRPATPSQGEKLKVSNRLYAMCPRSWRPDSSLGETVPVDSLGLDPSAASSMESPSVLHYTYSGQLEGQPLAWNPEDSLSTPVPPEEAPTPTPDEWVPTPTPSRQRRRLGTPDPNGRPFSAQQAEKTEKKPGVHRENQDPHLRPSSSTGGAEPSKRQRRKLPSIDNDLDVDKRERARRQKSGQDGWTGDEDEKDPIIRALSASRTRSWVASQNSLRPNSSQWQTEVEEFVMESTDLEDKEEVTPRAQSRQRGVTSARSSMSRNNMMEESGRVSRAIVMDGEDLSKYDNDSRWEKVAQNTEDKETLEQLEWELASESGRITADGNISRISAVDTDNDCGSSGSRSSSNTVKMSFDQDYIATKLKADEFSEGENEDRVCSSSLDILDEEAVRALR